MAFAELLRQVFSLWLRQVFSLWLRQVFSFSLREFSRFGHGFNRSRQFRLGRFRSAMVAMVQRLDARSFFFRPQLSVCAVSAFVLKIFWNRFSCHGS